MANISDTYLVLNSLVKQNEGKIAITESDITDTASFGKKLLSSEDETSKDVVFKALIDRIGKTIIDMLAYDNKFARIFKDAFAYGSVLQTIHVSNFEAKKSGIYDNLDNGDVDEDIYKMYLPTVDQTLFENIQPWEFAVTITDKQIESAFVSAEGVAGFINGIFTAMKNSIVKYLETCARTCYENLIVSDINKGGNVSVNVLQKFYEETGKALTPYNYQYDADFNRWLTSLFTDYVGLFEEMTVLFNHKEYETFTPRDMCHLVVNNKIADNIKRFMTSNVYNDELVSMPYYDEVSSWQAIGTNGSLDNRISVNAKFKNPNYVQGGTEPEYISANKKVIAVMHDDRVLSLTLKDRRTVTKVNEHGARRNVWEQGTVCNFVNLGHNSVVFYVDYVNLNTLADTIGVATSTGSVYGVTVSSIQTGVTVNTLTGKITGTLKKQTSGTLATDWGEGYFIALKITGITDDEYVRIGMTPSVSTGLVHIPSDDNENVFKVTDLSQKFTVEVTKDGVTDVKYYDLSDLQTSNS